MSSVSILRKAFFSIGLDIRRRRTDEEKAVESLRFLRNFSDNGSVKANFLRTLLKYAIFSKSQMFQDIFVISALNEKRNGYFVEFGATDGVRLSNTYMLENEFGWTGLLSEPAPVWHGRLAQNRPYCKLDFRCVASTSGNTVVFRQTEQPEFSTIASYSSSDLHRRARNIKFEQHEVLTVSLGDLLAEHSAPKEIDYISIDTEGSELEIIENFDFEKYKFRTLSVEHNFSSNKSRIVQILESAGYSQVLEEYSEFDAWFLNKDVLDIL